MTFFESSAISQTWFKTMKFLSLFSCFSVVNILFGNPKPCGSKFLRIQLFERKAMLHALVFLELRSSSAITQIWFNMPIHII